MNLHHLRLVLAAAWVLAIGACATGGPAPVPGRSMPAARAALAPEFRLFYDALEDQGEWVLIEPYGYLFRPSVSYHTWQPYEEGFWAPTDNYGWVWISSEPFGWATYHYGRWLHDDYQGWVWQPGLEWGPAWVDWQIAGDYVGWSPLMAGRSTGVPSATLYAPIDQLGATDLSMRLKRADDPVVAAAEAHRIDNQAMRGGVLVNLGPSISRVERATGPLRRVRVDDLVSVPGAGPETPGVSSPAPASAEQTRRAAERAANEARIMSERGGTPPRSVSVVRPVAPAPAPGTILKRDLRRGAEKKAPADTTAGR